MVGQKASSGIDKQGGGMMMLIKKLVKSGNFEKSVNKEAQIRKST